MDSRRPQQVRLVTCCIAIQQMLASRMYLGWYAEQQRAHSQPTARTNVKTEAAAPAIAAPGAAVPAAVRVPFVTAPAVLAVVAPAAAAVPVAAA